MNDHLQCVGPWIKGFVALALVRTTTDIALAPINHMFTHSMPRSLPEYTNWPPRCLKTSAALLVFVCISKER